jgi:hypothetical protein
MVGAGSPGFDAEPDGRPLADIRFARQDVFVTVAANSGLNQRVQPLLYRRA